MDHRYFKLKGADGDTYLVRHDEQSMFGSEPPPKAMTLNILKDTPESSAWLIDMVDEKGQSMSFSWSGPKDGSLQAVKDSKGQTLGQESLKMDKDGALLRRGVDSNDGSS